MNELALFAGSGGGILGGKLLGWRTVCAVERDAYSAAVLAQRQNDGCLAPFPIWSDVETFDGRPWRGIVDVVSGGFPCQDISVAGKGAGITGQRSGLWGHMRRIIRQVRPPFVFVENSPALTGRGLGTVLGDLAALGYDARWGVVSAADAIWLGGAPCLDHLRERIWIVGARPDAVGRDAQAAFSDNRQAGADCTDGQDSAQHEAPVDSTSAIGDRRRDGLGWREPRPLDVDERGAAGTHWWGAEPGVGRVVHGVAHRVDRISALGNGQVPAVAALAWRILSNHPTRKEPMK